MQIGLLLLASEFFLLMKMTGNNSGEIYEEAELEMLC